MHPEKRSSFSEHSPSSLFLLKSGTPNERNLSQPRGQGRQRRQEGEILCVKNSGKLIRFSFNKSIG